MCILGNIFDSVNGKLVSTLYLAYNQLMAVTCGLCRHCKEANAEVIELLKEPGTGRVVKTESKGNRHVLLCKPPLVVSAFPYRDQVVNRAGTCPLGESK